MAYRRTAQVQERLDAARERILDAALVLVSQDGWRAATMAAVARGADVATGTVYRHFDGKDHLFGEVFRRAAGREFRAVAEAAASAGSPVERIAAALRLFAERALNGSRLAYALLAEPASPAVERERLAYRSGYRELFRELLLEAVEVGELAPHDGQVVAAVITGAMGETLVGPLSPMSDAVDRPERGWQIDALVSACLRALPSSPGERPGRPRESG